MFKHGCIKPVLSKASLAWQHIFDSTVHFAVIYMGKKFEKFVNRFEH